MKAVGLIAEYNPFHNGHLYHLNKIKELYKDYVIIAVMSGNFTQRGDASIINKFDKTKIALEHNIDIVIELPFQYATSAADIFAKGSIEILKDLKIEALVFGSESNDIELLKENSNVLIKNENLNIRKNLKKGESYPKTILKLLENITKNEIKTPNDILGICYIKEITKQKANIKPVPIQRTNDYHSKKIEFISSATSIRKGLLDKKNIKNSVPIFSYSFLKDELFYLDDYFELLKYKIISDDNLKIYQDVDEGLENRIKKYIIESNSLEELIQKIKTKRYTYNKIKRMLLHILTNYTKTENKKQIKRNYIRVLGFSKKGQKYLNQIKKDLKLKLITNCTKELETLKLDLKATEIYSLISKNKKLIKSEYDPIIKTNR